MVRITTKIGDVFSVEIDTNKKKYFQLIAYDTTQLNSDVIRAFSKVYEINESPSIDEIIKHDVDFYAHCVTKVGIKMKLWQKVGKAHDVGNIEKIIFRGTSDYGIQNDKKEVSKISDNWYVWRINDVQFERVGKLEDENRNSYIGMVINPLGIIELLRGNKYPPLYPDFT